jgi:hypothetical protein
LALGEGDILGTATAYIIFTPKGRKKIFSFKSAPVNLKCGGKKFRAGGKISCSGSILEQNTSPAVAVYFYGLDHELGWSSLFR